jgi:hypothetical protein
MTTIPKPDISQAVHSLRERDEYKVIMTFIRDERDRFFGDCRQCENPNDVMKLVGSIAAMDELLTYLDQ